MIEEIGLQALLVSIHKSIRISVTHVLQSPIDLEFTIILITISRLLAVLFRQTNIIWVAFVAVQSIGPYFIHTIHCAQIEQTDQQQPAKFSLTTTGQTWEVFFIYFICKYMVI